MSDIAINVEKISVLYKFIDHLSFRRHRINKKQRRFAALKDISFSVNRGDIVGIVGSNGSGKSTLLKVIAGVFSPDSGRILTYNNTLSLLALGIGFQKNLSGKDNIYLSGMLHGFSKNEIKFQLDEIISFSGLGEFIDKPVNTYSSGMYSKLGFSIITILKPDILLIDEILSVGDRKFRKKSSRKMKELIQDSQRTVLIVSHNLDSIQDLCNKVIWLDNGELVDYGETKRILSDYIKFSDS